MDSPKAYTVSPFPTNSTASGALQLGRPAEPARRGSNGSQRNEHGKPGRRSIDHRIGRATSTSAAATTRASAAAATIPPPSPPAPTPCPWRMTIRIMSRAARPAPRESRSRPSAAPPRRPSRCTGRSLPAANPHRQHAQQAGRDFRPEQRAAMYSVIGWARTLSRRINRLPLRDVAPQSRHSPARRCGHRTSTHTLAENLPDGNVEERLVFSVTR